jgi:hypothetical protein
MDGTRLTVFDLEEWDREDKKRLDGPKQDSGHSHAHATKVSFVVFLYLTLLNAWKQTVKLHHCVNVEMYLSIG